MPARSSAMLSTSTSAAARLFISARSSAIARRLRGLMRIRQVR